MNAETFCEHFATFADAPNGTERLRELILDLAVQGKLVPQDPNDEPAIRFLLSTDGDRGGDLGAKLLAGEASDASHNNRFSIPASWDWARIGQLGETQTGTTPKSGDHEAFGSDYPFIKPADILRDKVVYDNVGLSRTGVEKYGRLATAGSVLMVCIGTIGKCNVITRDCSFNQQINSITPLPQVDSSLLLYFLQSPYFQTEAWQRSTSTTISLLNKGNWESIPIPIPPLAEQRRIVEKVDQLLGLCDELAARQAAQREKRQRLVGATLDRLVSTRNPAEFPTHAHRLRNHFDQLFDTPTTIPQLRQTILQLAVQGQLVPQDAHDEPADTLLRQIFDEKDRLQRAGEFRSQDGPLPIAGKEELFTIPRTWKWVRAAELSYPISSGSTPAKDVFQASADDGVPYLKVYNIRNQKIDFDYCPQFIKKPHHDAKMKRSKLVPGMVVLNIVGPPLGKTAIIPPRFPEWNCNQAIAFFRLVGDVLPEYIHLYFCAGLFLKNIELIGTAGQDNISVTKCKNIVIPLPPFAEQKRIVTKVTELLSLCDALEAKLTQAESASTQLLSATVHHLLNNSVETVP